jgi:hypothetical protein
MKNFIPLFFLSLMLVSSCKKDDEKSLKDIPADPGTAVPITTINNLNTSIPNPQFNVGSGNRITMSLSGIKDPNTLQWIDFRGTGTSQNIWIEEDGVNKGIAVSKVSSKKSGKALAADIVFTIDNSGSMSEEADSVANQMVKFVEFLSQSGLDVRVGTVGYDGGINGALNLTKVANLKKYLIDRLMYGYPVTGTNRTNGFSGSDSVILENKAYNFASSVSNENGVTAVFYADSFFTWRSGAQRVYINFTDEGIQPCGDMIYSVQGFASRWNALKGTVHSVFSIDADYWSGMVPDTSMEHNNYTSWNEDYQRPWQLSFTTGGTIKFIHSDCSDLNLLDLPVTGSLANSYLIEYISANTSLNHILRIVVKNGSSSDGTKQFSIKYNGK